MYELRKADDPDKAPATEGTDETAADDASKATAENLEETCLKEKMLAQAQQYETMLNSCLVKRMG